MDFRVHLLARRAGIAEPVARTWRCPVNRLTATVIFPFTTRNSEQHRLNRMDPFDPVSRIDREVADRPRRLAIGISLEHDLQTLCGALIVAEGKGKYLRVMRAVSCRRELPQVAVGILRQNLSSGEPSFRDIRAVQSDIATSQAEIVQELKQHCGKYVDRLLCIALTDPGHWIEDDASDRTWLPICDPNLIADTTGISVVDSFPSRDISVGGNGKNLDALPAWILFADRSSKRASRDRILFSLHEEARAFFLPASDGLDLELPEIQIATAPGLSLLFPTQPSFPRRREPSMPPSKETRDEAIAYRLESGGVNRSIKRIANQTISQSECLRTFVAQTTNQLTERIRNQKIKTSMAPDIIVDCPDELSEIFINQLQCLWKDSTIHRDCLENVAAGDLNAVLTATLGMISIDQLPANLPSITGAHSQRNLGRFTPGAPSNWRQLLCEMADFHPPAMRLRDAVQAAV